ncbi:MAG: aldehyde dehydrogenase family protein [Bacteroidetes bacterium]|nr:aldehyde dehydrogenase family protein [Bacteroidota bacterium]
MNSLDPATGSLIGELEATSPDLIQGIVSEARSAQQEWSRLPLRKRSEHIRQFGEILVSRKRIAAELISQENGKPIAESYTSEIIPTLDIVRYYAYRSAGAIKDRRVHNRIPLMKTKKAFVRYEPYGVIGIISPWNYPLLLPCGQIIPALMTGNTVVFKPSEYTPLVGDMIAQFLWETGIPRKVFNIVQGGGDVGAALACSKVNKLFFTGSTATGKKISGLAANTLTPLSLELGSKDAMIVLDDADIDSAASGAIWGSLMNAGQTCVSIERCFVHEKIYDRFLDVLQTKIKKLRTGKGSDAGTDIGPIIHKAQFDTIRFQVEDAVRKGARIAAGGDFLEKNGTYFISPTVLIDLPKECSLMTEETFGPVLPITRFSSDDEAIGLANDSRFGLAASVWTADKKRGMAIAQRLQAGAVILNDIISYYGNSDGVVGGPKESGSGRVHGREGLFEMVFPKYYEIERAWRTKKLWWYPYDSTLLHFFEATVDLLFSKSLFAKSKSLLKLVPNFLRIKKI